MMMGGTALIFKLEGRASYRVAARIDFKRVVYIVDCQAGDFNTLIRYEMSTWLGVWAAGYQKDFFKPPED